MALDKQTDRLLEMDTYRFKVLLIYDNYKVLLYD